MKRLVDEHIVVLAGLSNLENLVVFTGWIILTKCYASGPGDFGNIWVLLVSKCCGACWPQ